jgi:hypothetical protein
LLQGLAVRRTNTAEHNGLFMLEFQENEKYYLENTGLEKFQIFGAQ